MVRTARYKYIVFAEGENREQLFDMEKDPGELKNLIADPALTTEVERHRRLLDDPAQKTDLAGKNPKLVAVLRALFDKERTRSKE